MSEKKGQPSRSQLPDSETADQMLHHILSSCNMPQTDISTETFENLSFYAAHRFIALKLLTGAGFFFVLCCPLLLFL